MPTVIIERLASTLSLVIALVTIGAVEAAQGDGQTIQFHSDQYGYSVQYPASWHTNPYSPRKGVLDIINFPPAKAAHAVFLPRSGASITLEPIEAVQGSVDSRSSMRRRIPHNLDDWIEISEERRKVLSTRDLVFPGIHAIEIIAEYSTGSEAVDWFLEYPGPRLFRATVVFWRDDDGSKALIPVMRQIVLSVKLTP